MRDLGSQVVLVVLGAQRGVLGRLGHPTDLDLALARQRPAGEPDPGTPNLKQGRRTSYDAESAKSEEMPWN